MTYRNTGTHRLTARTGVLTTVAMLAAVAQAQVGQPAYPQAQGYPQTAPPMQFAPQAMPQAAPQAHPIRDLFAGTLAAVVQTATGGLLGAINGRLTDWFARKSGAQNQGFPAQGQGFAGAAPAATYPAPAAAYPAPVPSAYPASPDPAAGAYPPAQTPSYPSTSPYPPATGYPPAASDASTANPYAAAQNPYAAAAPQVYDARTGQVVTDNANNPYAAAPASGSLYAGVAYEVHALGADGSATPINAATYEFRSGDRFKVLYRPSLPGRMEVYNINPAGQQILIDASNMAAGQLTELGPYRFTRLTGDESLRLVLSPCSSPQLLATTRDIVRDDAAPSSALSQPTGAGVQLSSCGAPTARGLRRAKSRDIEKVAVDGTVSYALDPVSQQEQTTGQVAPRELTIVFRHR